MLNSTSPIYLFSIHSFRTACLRLINSIIYSFFFITIDQFRCITLISPLTPIKSLTGIAENTSLFILRSLSTHSESHSNANLISTIIMNPKSARPENAIFPFKN